MPRALVLLELGPVSVEYLIKQKRAGYLHVLLNASEDSISKAVFQQQLDKPLPGDWASYIKNDLKELDIQMSFEEIGIMSKGKWKSLVRKRAREACFKSLIKDKAKLSKGKEICYNKLETQCYFRPGTNLTTETKRRIFKVRSRDLLLKCNFPGAFDDLKCVTGCDEDSIDDQKHLFYCPVLSGNTVMSENVRYENIFIQNNVFKQEQVVNIIFDHFQKRNKILSPDC